jgi:pimeloyl-ACP methyl ester carboxylesterase
MTVADQEAAVAAWDEPAGLNPRGTLIVIPGRGEQPGVYERLGRRLAGDAYRVRVVSDPTADLALATAEVAGLLAGPASVAPRVLVGSDTGALFAAGLTASGRAEGADALVLAGLPVPAAAPAAGPAGPPAASAGSPAAAAGPAGPSAGGGGGAAAAPAWEDELDARTTCPTHRERLAGPELRRGALYDAVPDGWDERADLAAITVPILGIHGAEDQVSPLAAVRPRYAAASGARLVSIAGTRHDALNNQTHRTVAATIVLFLERLRQGGEHPAIAVSELP